MRLPLAWVDDSSTPCDVGMPTYCAQARMGRDRTDTHRRTEGKKGVGGGGMHAWRAAFFFFECPPQVGRHLRGPKRKFRVVHNVYSAGADCLAAWLPGCERRGRVARSA